MSFSLFRAIFSSRSFTCSARAQLAPPPRSPPEHIHLYSLLLRRCAEQKSISQTRRVHLRMKQVGFPYLSLGNKLIHAYLTSGSIEGARQVFDEMPQPHIVSWNSMISSYIRHRRTQEAVSLYKQMLTKGVIPDAFTFSTIFKAFSALNFINGGRATHGQLVVLGQYATSLYVCSALVDLYAKFGRMLEAHIAYNAVTTKDIVLATTLIVGYTQRGKDREAITVFNEMAMSGIKANDFTFASILIACANLKELSFGRVIHGVILKSGFRVVPQTSLITLYSKSDLVEDSIKVFYEIVSPNTVAWTSIVGCLLDGRREEEALSMFHRMVLDSVKPNAFTLSTALRACSSLAFLEQGKLIHGYALKTGLDTNTFVSSSLVDTYGKCGHVEMARTVFDGLPAPDLASLNSLIGGYAQSGDGAEAVRLFYWIRSMGVEPDGGTHVSVLSACSKSGMVEEGRRIYSSMVSPTNDHHACMVDLLGRAGKLIEARELVTKVQGPDKVVWRTLLGACKIHGEFEMAKWAAKRALELDPSDDGTYALLSSIYASLGEWEEVSRMKSLMREKGMKKGESGLSWIRAEET